MSAWKHQEGRDYGPGTALGRQTPRGSNTCGRALQLHGSMRRHRFMTTGRRPSSAGARISGHSFLVEGLPRAKGQKKKCLGFGLDRRGKDQGV